MNEQPPERESIWSIGRKWLPWYFGLIFALTIGWTAFIAWLEITGGNHESLPTIVNAVVKGTATAAPLIPIYALMAIAALDIAGGATVVTARYLGDKFLKPLHERLRQEGREEGREERQRQWEAWNQRREEAGANGEPFNEPPPGSGENGSQPVE